jgi:hypothetical protein
MLNKVKLILGITGTEKDDLLQTLIDQAIDYIASYTHNPGCIGLLSGTVVDMVVYKYSRLGTEGMQSESYSGNSFTYTNDYPDSVITVLKKYRKMGIF